MTKKKVESEKILDYVSEIAGMDKEEIGEKLSEVKDDVTSFVKKNPLTSIGIAAGVGFLLAKFFSKRR